MTKTERIEFLKDCTDKQRKVYYLQVARLTCVLCGQEASLHHCSGNSFPAKRKHRPVIPLCYNHHQGRQGIHTGKQTFEANYGTQAELLEQIETCLS